MTAATEPEPPSDEQARSGDWGWERHGQDQREAWLASTPAQRLAWLEDALRFASESGAWSTEPEVPYEDRGPEH